MVIATSILKLQGNLNSHKHVLYGVSIEIGYCFHNALNPGEVYASMNTPSHTQLLLQTVAIAMVQKKEKIIQLRIG